MKKCKKCGRSFSRLLALSRTDNKTMICDDCGIREAKEITEISARTNVFIDTAIKCKKWSGNVSNIR